MTTRGRVLRSHTRTNRSVRFNQLLELSTVLSEADQETKEKVETAEILSILGFASSTSVGQDKATRESASRSRAAVATNPPHPQTHLPLPTIQPIAPAPAKLPQPQPQVIRPAASKPVTVLPAATGPLPANGKLQTVAPQQAVEGEKKRKRSKTTPDQLRILMEEFHREPMPNANTRQSLATRLGMTPRSVQIWFQNMRAKVKKANAAMVTSGSAPGEGKKGADSTNESDGPIRKRQRVDGDSAKRASDVSSTNNSTTATKMDVEQSQKNNTGAAASPTNVATKTGQAHQPIKIAVPHQQSSVRSVESGNNKLPLPPIQHITQPIYGVPLQYIPQSFHCDQLKRAMPAIAALTNAGQQMTA